MPDTVVVNGVRCRLADLPPDVAALVRELGADCLTAQDVAQAARRKRVMLDARPNPLLDDAFGLPPAVWGAAVRPPEAAPVPPGTRRAPSGDKRAASPVPTRQEKANALQTPSAPTALVLERPGEDLQYLAGRWLHRCNSCGPWECLIERRPGANPTTVWVPVGWVPRTQPITHAPDCPHRGAF